MSRQVSTPSEEDVLPRPQAYDSLTLELSEIKMLAEMVDTIEEGFINDGQASLLARLIIDKVDAACVHARNFRNGGAK